MTISFYKYEGTGNDFILADNRLGNYSGLSVEQIATLCNRRFGIGADGLMLLQNKPGYDFEMVYYNSDGRQSSMCGNGGRCITAFARRLGIITDKARFAAIDGDHEAVIAGNDNNRNSLLVKLKMGNVKEVCHAGNDLFIDTGSPHHLIRVNEDVLKKNIVAEARTIRYSPQYEKEGVNVNFIQQMDNGVRIRTYERGVEDETLSCGTGSTAAALAAHALGWIGEEHPCRIFTMGGELKVYFQKNGEGYKNIWLEGPATFVYEGVINV